MYNCFVFDVITASSYCHHDAITMSPIKDMKKNDSMRLKKVLNMKN